jgi:hypothetical protein
MRSTPRRAIAAIGIVKGQPFQPDKRMKKLLAEAATVGNATARAITYHPRIDGVSIYPDSRTWTWTFADKNPSFEADGTMNLDGTDDNRQRYGRSSAENREIFHLDRCWSTEATGAD